MSIIFFSRKLLHTPFDSQANLHYFFPWTLSTPKIKIVYIKFERDI